jgi:hypothetical protein
MLSDSNPVLTNKRDIKRGKLAELCQFLAYEGAAMPKQ